MANKIQDITLNIKKANKVFPNITKVNAHDLTLYAQRNAKNLTGKEFNALLDLREKFDRGHYGGHSERFAIPKKGKVIFRSLDDD